MKKDIFPLETNKIEHALGYPFAQLRHSYVIRNSEIFDLPHDFWPAGRLPVIACGSNASPQQLIRKFRGIETDPIYVTQARLSDFVCCYSAHITSYGSIPATLAPVSGNETDCHITWLTEAQLDHMHVTEAIGQNYRFSHLDKIELRCLERGILNDAYAYISLHGNILLNDAPIIVSNIDKISSTGPSQLTQFHIQLKISEQLAPKNTVEEFILANISDGDVRRDRTKKLRQNAQGFSYPFEKIILT